MNLYILDTNVVSELRKLRPHGAVPAWMNTLVREQFFVSSLTFGELQVGAEKTRLQDPQKAQEIEEFMDHLSHSVQVLPMDALCFREWARLMRGKSDALYEDAMIAATARIHGLIVATRNETDFGPFGVTIFNPFKVQRER